MGWGVLARSIFLGMVVRSCMERGGDAWGLIQLCLRALMGLRSLIGFLLLVIYSMLLVSNTA
jgi:hypothetical protein